VQDTGAKLIVATPRSASTSRNPKPKLRTKIDQSRVKKRSRIKRASPTVTPSIDVQSGVTLDLAKEEPGDAKFDQIRRHEDNQDPFPRDQRIPSLAHDAALLSPNYAFTVASPQQFILSPVTPLLDAMDLIPCHTQHDINRITQAPYLQQRDLTQPLDYSSIIEDVSTVSNTRSPQRYERDGKTYIPSQYVMATQDSMWSVMR
jgi:hypothetical protein